MDLDPLNKLHTSPFIPPGESIATVFVLLESVACLDLIDQSLAWHVIRSSHPVDVARCSSLVLAYWLELLSLGAGAAHHVDLIPALLGTTYVHIPTFTPTITAPNSSHA